MELNQVYVSRIKNEDIKVNLIEIWKEMQEKAFLGLRASGIESKISSQLDDLEIADLKKFLLDTLDNNMLYVPYSEIDDSDYEIDTPTIDLNKQFFGDSYDV
jgi:adenine-specific DNA-methyltransferase